MTLITCRLTAKNRDQLRNPMLGNRVWATFFSVRRTSFSWAVCALLMRLHTHRIVFNYNGLFSLSNRKQGLKRNLCVRFFLVYRYYPRCSISSLAAENVSLSFHMRGENTSDVTSNFSRKRVVLTDMLHQACLSICGKKTIWRRFVSLKGQSAQPDHLKLPQRQLCMVLYIHTYIQIERTNLRRWHRMTRR